MSSMIGNPFISYLNRYTTASPEHEAAFDEFITQSIPPSGQPLRLQTQIENFLRTCFERQHPPSIILTGNAGDGKTYLCRQIIEAFTRQPVHNWDRIDWPIEHHNLTLRVVKDLSEMGEEAGANVLRDLSDQLTSQPQHIFLIAANEGRLRAVLRRERLHELYEEVDHQLRRGPNLNNERLIVVNLNLVTTSTYVPQVLSWITDSIHWQACQECPAFNRCPIRFNATRLTEPYIARRFQFLYQVLEHLNLHVTIRDMLIHLTYALTSGLDCQEIIEQSNQLGWEAYHHVYYENVWGERADETFRRKAIVIQYLRRLNVGEASVFAVDDFLINGRPNDETAQAEHNRLFAPALDLGGRRFVQDRQAYLYGGSGSPQLDDEHPLMTWLPHCRRKLFFEWQDNVATDRLFPFIYLPDYFRLIHGERAALHRYRRDLILGLNRAFSGLYLTDAAYLYVTSQYTHTIEQPVPIVRVRIPTDYINLCINTCQTEAFDRDWTSLLLEIPPPPRIPANPIRWTIDLLRFEYLMRRSRGSTLNVLAAECELAIRQLKDELLSHFVCDSDRVEFFVADRNCYTLQTLWIDDRGRIQCE